MNVLKSKKLALPRPPRGAKTLIAGFTAVIIAGGAAAPSGETFALWRQPLPFILSGEILRDLRVPKVDLPSYWKDSDSCYHFDTAWDANQPLMHEISFNSLNEIFNGPITLQVTYRSTIGSWNQQGNSRTGPRIGITSGLTAPTNAQVMDKGNLNTSSYNWVQFVNSNATNVAAREKAVQVGSAVEVPATFNNITIPGTGSVKIWVNVFDASDSGSWDGYFEKGRLSFKITGPAKPLMGQALEQNNQIEAFAQKGITLSPATNTVTWESSVLVPGLFDNYGSNPYLDDTPWAGRGVTNEQKGNPKNGMACVAGERTLVGSVVFSNAYAYVGQPALATFTRTTPAGNVSGFTTRFEWFADGVPIPDSTYYSSSALPIVTGSFTPTEAQVGKTLTVLATVGRYTDEAHPNFVTYPPSYTSPGIPVIKTGQPFNLNFTRANDDGTQITLKWDTPASMPTDAVLDYYRVYRSTGTNAPDIDISGATGTNYLYPTSGKGVTATQINEPNLTQGLDRNQAYNFWVQAVTTTGTRLPWSQMFTVGAVPGVPTNPSAARGNTQATLSWTAPVTPAGGLAANLYEYVWSTSTTRPELSTSNSRKTESVTGTAVTGLTNGTPINFWVRAYNARGYGDWSGMFSTTPATTPSALTAAPTINRTSATNAILSWNALPVTSNGGSVITKYRIARCLSSVATAPSTTATSQSNCIFVTVDTSANPSYTFQSGSNPLTDQQAYNFWVQAVNDVGNGAWSPVVTTAVPTKVTGLSFYRSNNTVSLRWTSNSATISGGEITGYEYHRCTGASCAPSGTSTWSALTLGNVASGNQYANDLTITAPTGSTTERFFVRAKSYSGPGASGDAANFRNSRALTISEDLLGQSPEVVTEQLLSLEMNVAGDYVIEPAESETRDSPEQVETRGRALPSVEGAELEGLDAETAEPELVVTDILLVTEVAYNDEYVTGGSVVGEEVEIGSTLQLVVAPAASLVEGEDESNATVEPETPATAAAELREVVIGADGEFGTPVPGASDIVHYELEGEFSKLTVTLEGLDDAEEVQLFWTPEGAELPEFNGEYFEISEYAIELELDEDDESEASWLLIGERVGGTVSVLFTWAQPEVPNDDESEEPGVSTGGGANPGAATAGDRYSEVPTDQTDGSEENSTNYGIENDDAVKPNTEPEVEADDDEPGKEEQPLDVADYIGYDLDDGDDLNGAGTYYPEYHPEVYGS